MLSPVSSMEWAEWTIRSRIASATVGSPTMSYQLDDGYCEVIIGVECAYASFAGLVAQGTGEEAFACAGKSCYEEILSVADEVKSGQTFHLVAVKTAADRIVDFLEICLVTERSVLCQSRYRRLRAVVPLAAEKH